MTADDLHLVFLERLDTWLAFSKYDPDRPALLDHMGMTLDEFIEWRQRGGTAEEGM